MNLALGFFDGVHLGHRAVIKNADTVVTFKDHPFCHLYNLTPKYIITREERKRRIQALGADVVELEFSDVAQMSAAEYLEFLREKFAPEKIITGYNHTFGTDKMGPEFLRERFKNYIEVPPVMLDGEIISSTKIRTALCAGDIPKANAMLGYNFSVSGEVVEGKKLGRELGFPTANLIYPNELIEIPYGVYVVKVGQHKAVANFGVRPTVDGSQPLLEVHIPHFDENLYGQKISVEFLKMLRPEQKFATLDELKAQIWQDISNVTNYEYERK